MSDSYQPFYQDFDSLTGMLGQILGLRAADSAFTPHAGKGMPEPGGGDTGGGAGGGLLGVGGEGGIPPNMSGMLDMVRGMPSTDHSMMDPNNPLMSPPATAMGSDASRMPPGDPRGQPADLQNYSVGPPGVPGGQPPDMGPMPPAVGAPPPGPGTAGGIPGQGGGLPPPEAPGPLNPVAPPGMPGAPPIFMPPAGMPGAPPMPPGAGGGPTPPPGALPPAAAPAGPGALPQGPAPLTPPAPRENPLEALKRQLLGDTGQSGRPQRGGLYDNPTRRMMASLGAGLTGLDKNPGSKFGAFAAGAGRSMGAGSKQDMENRVQDEKEAGEQFKEDDTIYKRMVHDPYDLMQKQINISKGQAQTDLLNARRDATVNGKPGGVNSKMWQDPFGRQVLVDREIARKMAEEWKTHRSKYDKVTNMSGSKIAERQADEDRIRKMEIQLKADMYKEHKIDPAQVEKNKTIGENQANPFNPVGMGLTKQEFEKLVPPGKWFIPKDGAPAVMRAGKSVSENAQDLAGEREKDIKGQRDNQLNATEEQELYQ